MDIYAEELGTVPPDLVLALRSAFDRNCVDEFWSVWSAGSEVGLLRSCRRAGGPSFLASRPSLVVALCRSGGVDWVARLLGGGGSCKWYRVARGDDVDVSSSLPLLLCCYFGGGLRL